MQIYNKTHKHSNLNKYVITKFQTTISLSEKATSKMQVYQKTQYTIMFWEILWSYRSALVFVISMVS